MLGRGWTDMTLTSVLFSPGLLKETPALLQYLYPHLQDWLSPKYCTAQKPAVGCHCLQLVEGRVSLRVRLQLRE